MKISDIAAGLALCRHAGWNQLAPDWEIFLRMSPDGCRVAVDGTGSVVGSVATISYGRRFSWIGMVLVDPSFRRRGIGTRLLNEAIGILSREETVKLDATPIGREVYLRLNFSDEYRLSRMEAPSINLQALPKSQALPLELPDWKGLLENDIETFGADRSDLFRSLHEGAPQYAYVVRGDREGYCFGRHGYRFEHIGPVIAEDISTAISLVSAGLRSCGDRPVILDVPHHTPAWLDWLSGLGFKEQRPFIRMYRGANTHPGIPEKQFAVLGPEFG